MAGPKRRAASELPSDFAEFWAEYPRKVDRGHALKAWQRASREGRLPPLEEILAAVRRQALSTGWQDERYIPHAATWINGDRWADLPPKPADGPARASPVIDTVRRSPKGYPLPITATPWGPEEIAEYEERIEYERQRRAG